MNFQERLIDASAALRARATSLALSTADGARARASVAAARIGLERSLAALTLAGRELNKVARRHASRFVKQNAAIAVAAGKDLGTLARSTYVSIAGRKPVTKARKTRATAARKRTVKKAA